MLTSLNRSTARDRANGRQTDHCHADHRRDGRHERPCGTEAPQAPHRRSSSLRRVDLAVCALLLFRLESPIDLLDLRSPQRRPTAVLSAERALR